MKHLITTPKDQEVKIQGLSRGKKKQWVMNLIFEGRVQNQVLYQILIMVSETSEDRIIHKIQVFQEFLMLQDKMVLTIEMKIYCVLFWLC